MVESKRIVRESTELVAMSYSGSSESNIVAESTALGGYIFVDDGGIEDRAGIHRTGFDIDIGNRGIHYLIGGHRAVCNIVEHKMSGDRHKLLIAWLYNSHHFSRDFYF